MTDVLGLAERKLDEDFSRSRLKEDQSTEQEQDAESINGVFGNTFDHRRNLGRDALLGVTTAAWRGRSLNSSYGSLRISPVNLVR